MTQSSSHKAQNTALERYLGYHFTPTSVLAAEAFHSRDDHLQWDIFKQPNYELPPEWQALYKEAIPNLYDTQQQVFGFQALPAMWSGLSKGRFHRYDATFFRAIAQGKFEKSALSELTRFLKYSLVYHVKPQPDEALYVTLVLDDLQDEDLGKVLSALQAGINLPNVSFISTISPQEAVLHFLWYRFGNYITDKTALVIDMGYLHTEFTVWVNGAPDAPMQAHGMRHIDNGVCTYLQNNNDRAAALDLADQVLYAQRARYDYESGQDEIPIFQFSAGEWTEMSEKEYLTLIQSGASDITNQLKQAVSGRAKSIEQVIITGEGAAFPPVADQVLEACTTLKLPQPIVLAHSTVSAAQGAAGLSFEVRHSVQQTKELD